MSICHVYHVVICAPIFWRKRHKINENVTVKTLLLRVILIINISHYIFLSFYFKIFNFVTTIYYKSRQFVASPTKTVVYNNCVTRNKFILSLLHFLALPIVDCLFYYRYKRVWNKCILWQTKPMIIFLYVTFYSRTKWW